MRLKLRVKGGLGRDFFCALRDWERWEEKGKGNHMEYLRPRFLGQHAAMQLVAAWAWRADYP